MDYIYRIDVANLGCYALAPAVTYYSRGSIGCSEAKQVKTRCPASEANW